MKKRKGFFSKKDVTINSRRKECGGEETTLIGVCAQIVHTTQFSLHMQSGISHGALKDSSFLFLVLNGGKKLLHHDRDNDHSIVVLHFADHLPQFLNTLN